MSQQSPARRFPAASLADDLETAAAAAFDSLPAPAAILTDDGTIRFSNQSWRLFAAMNGGALDGDVGRDYLETCRRAAATGDAIAAEAGTGLTELLAGRRDSFELEYPCDAPHERRWFILQASRMSAGGAVVSHVDITRRKLLELRLHALAGQDPLTGLANRRAIQEALADPLSVAVLYCDLDGFKDVNDTLGHAMGDELLALVAARLREAVRPGDQVGRIGGDEFVIVCRLVDPHAAEVLRARLRAVVAQPYLIRGQEIRLDCSIGIARRREGEPVERTLSRADAAMYVEKRRHDRRPCART